MSWEIALGIFALVSFVLGILAYKNNKNEADDKKAVEEQKQRQEILMTLTKLNTTVETLNDTIKTFQTTSDEIHKELFDKVNALEKKLVKHDSQIEHLINEVKKI